jgi:integrase
MARKDPVSFRRGAWYVDHYDASGTRRQYRFKTADEAVAYAQKVGAYSRRRARHGVAAPIDPTVTVGAYAATWLDAIAPHLKPRAYEAHAAAVKLYIAPRLGTRRLVELTRADVKAFLTGCKKAGVSGRPLKPGSVRLVKSALSAMLNEAVEDGVCASNVAARLGRKFRFHPTAEERKASIEQRVLELEERAALSLATRQHAPAWYPLLLVYDRAGLRCGEGIGLHVDDVRFATGKLNVVRTLDERTGAEGPPKFGPRVVDLSPELVAVLKLHVAGLKRAILAAGATPGPWLFPSRDGGPLDASNVRRVLRRVALKAGLGSVSPHDLRHTFGDVLARTQSAQYVQQQLGHRDVGFTLRTYASLSRAEPRDGGVAALDSGMHVTVSSGSVTESSGSLTPDAGPADGRNGDILVTQTGKKAVRNGASRQNR